MSLNQCAAEQSCKALLTLFFVLFYYTCASAYWHASLHSFFFCHFQEDVSLKISPFCSLSSPRLDSSLSFYPYTTNKASSSWEWRWAEPPFFYMRTSMASPPQRNILCFAPSTLLMASKWLPFQKKNTGGKTWVVDFSASRIFPILWFSQIEMIDLSVGAFVVKPVWLSQNESSTY